MSFSNYKKNFVFFSKGPGKPILPSTKRFAVRRRPFNFRFANFKYLKTFFLLRRLDKKNLFRLTKFSKSKKKVREKFRSFKQNQIFKQRFFSLFSRFSRVFYYKLKLLYKSKLEISKFPRKKKYKRISYFIFPFLGFNQYSSGIKNKKFYKRRKIFYFYKYNFFSPKFQSYKQSASYFSKIKYYLHIKQTKNNMFFYLKNSLGRLLFNYTNGQTIYKGPRRTTPTAAELAGRQISKFLISNKILTVCLVFDSPVTSIVKSAVRGLSDKLDFSAMMAHNFASHNGMKLKSTRRV